MKYLLLISMVLLFLTACGTPEPLANALEDNPSLKSTQATQEPESEEDIQTLVVKNKKSEEMTTSFDVKSQIVISAEKSSELHTDEKSDKAQREKKRTKKLWQRGRKA